MESLLKAMLEEQRKTNHLLALLVEALADEQGDGEREPARYMDGSLVVPPTAEFIGDSLG